MSAVSVQVFLGCIQQNRSSDELGRALSRSKALLTSTTQTQASASFHIERLIRLATQFAEMFVDTREGGVSSIQIEDLVEEYEMKHVADLLAKEEIVEDYECPITTVIMQEPVRAADGFFYEQSAIQDWIKRSANPRSPLTNETLSNLKLVKDTAFAKKLKRYILRNPQSLAF